MGCRSVSSRGACDDSFPGLRMRMACGTAHTTGQSRDLSLSLEAQFKMTKFDFPHREAFILWVKGTFFGTR